VAMASSEGDTVMTELSNYSAAFSNYSIPCLCAFA
jgi:hypothetical protein